LVDSCKISYRKNSRGSYDHAGKAAEGTVVPSSDAEDKEVEAEPDDASDGCCGHRRRRNDLEPVIMWCTNNRDDDASPWTTLLLLLLPRPIRLVTSGCFETTSNSSMITTSGTAITRTSVADILLLLLLLVVVVASFSFRSVRERRFISCLSLSLSFSLALVRASFDAGIYGEDFFLLRVVE